MISPELMELMDQKSKEMVQMFQLVFTKEELDLITRVFGVQKLAVFMQLGAIMASTGRQAGLSLIGVILSTLKETGNMTTFFAEANSVQIENNSKSVH